MLRVEWPTTELPGEGELARMREDKHTAYVEILQIQVHLLVEEEKHAEVQQTAVMHFYILSTRKFKLLTEEPR